MLEQTRSRSPLDTLLSIWSRRKWLAILAFVAPLAAGVSLIAFLPNIYRSAATVLAERQQVPDFFVRATVTSALETRIQTISQEVLSQARLEALIARFDLYADLRQRVPIRGVVERMRGDIALQIKSLELRGQGQGMREASVAFTISYQGSDPRTVSLVTNTLASFFDEENRKAREGQASGTTEFLKVQLGETKKRLDDQEQRVGAFKRRYAGQLPQQIDTNLATLDHLYAQLRQNADGQTRLTERRQTLSSQLAEAESAGSSAGSMVPPELREAARLAQKQEELARLRIHFSEKYPDVMRLAAEVAALERELADANEARKNKPDPEADTTASPTPAMAATPYVFRLREGLAEVQTELRILKAEEGRLRGAVEGYQARVENVPQREQEFMELSRNYQSTRELYDSLTKRYEEAQLAQSMEHRQKGEQFRIIDQAVPNAQPAAPNRLRLLIVTLAGAIGLAVAVVLLAEFLDTSFHEVDDLRTFTNVPVLVSIPQILTRTDLRRRWWRMRLGATAAVLGLVMIVGIVYVAANGNDDLVVLLGKVAS
jgi:polysaccharide chain length determinant protein (PEP-CTERM system associated)